MGVNSYTNRHLCKSRVYRRGPYELPRDKANIMECASIDQLRAEKLWSLDVSTQSVLYMGTCILNPVVLKYWLQELWSL